MKNSEVSLFQLEDSSSLRSIGFVLLESASPCSTSPSLASTASPSASAKLLVSTSPWYCSLGKNHPKLKLLQVGLLMGVSSLLGFLGSVAFPLLRAKLGTPFTALIGSLTIYIYANICQHFTHFTQECPSWLFAMQSVQSPSFSLPHSS